MKTKTTDEIINDWDNGSYINTKWVEVYKIEEAFSKLKKWIEQNEGYRPYTEGYEIFQKEVFGE